MINTAAGQKIYEENGFKTWFSKLRLGAGAIALLFIPLSFVGAADGRLASAHRADRLHLCDVEAGIFDSQDAQGKLSERATESAGLFPLSQGRLDATAVKPHQ